MVNYNVFRFGCIKYYFSKMKTKEKSIMIPSGYVVRQRSTGYFLSKKLFWFPHGNVSEAWRHTGDIIERMKEYSDFNFDDIDFIWVWTDLINP